MSNLAKDDDIFWMIDGCGEQYMMTVCSLFFFRFIYFKSAKFWEEKRSLILASFAKVYTREKKLKSMIWENWSMQKILVSSIRESSSTKKKLRKLLLLFYQ